MIQPQFDITRLMGSTGVVDHLPRGLKDLARGTSVLPEFVPGEPSLAASTARGWGDSGLLTGGPKAGGLQGALVPTDWEAVVAAAQLPDFVREKFDAKFAVLAHYVSEGHPWLVGDYRFCEVLARLGFDVRVQAGAFEGIQFNRNVIAFAPPDLRRWIVKIGGNKAKIDAGSTLNLSRVAINQCLELYIHQFGFKHFSAWGKYAYRLPGAEGPSNDATTIVVVEEIRKAQELDFTTLEPEALKELLTLVRLVDYFDLKGSNFSRALPDTSSKIVFLDTEDVAEDFAQNPTRDFWQNGLREVSNLAQGALDLYDSGDVQKTALAKTIWKKLLVLCRTILNLKRMYSADSEQAKIVQLHETAMREEIAALFMAV